MITVYSGPDGSTVDRTGQDGDRVGQHQSLGTNYRTGHSGTTVTKITNNEGMANSGCLSIEYGIINRLNQHTETQTVKYYVKLSD